MTATLDHLHALYARTDDPWNFDTSAYEQAKFRATRDALMRPRYRAGLELGCGNGALARHLAPRCDRYTGVDAVARAVAAARRRVPGATFVHACYPCPLPDGDPDLVILSEVLYFLAPEEIARLARDLADRTRGADVICTTYLGDTEQMLQGAEALDRFAAAMGGALDLRTVVATDAYRIDRGTIGGTR